MRQVHSSKADSAMDCKGTAASILDSNCVEAFVRAGRNTGSVRQSSQKQVVYRTRTRHNIRHDDSPLRDRYGSSFAAQSRSESFAAPGRLLPPPAPVPGPADSERPARTIPVARTAAAMPNRPPGINSPHTGNIKVEV